MVLALIVAAIFLIRASRGEEIGVFEPLLALLGAIYPLIDILLNYDRFVVDPGLRFQPPSSDRSEEAYLNGRLRAHEMHEQRFVYLRSHHSPKISSKTYELESIDAAVELFEDGFVLLGEPGAGKTTTLLHLEHKAILHFREDRTKYRLPVWINLGLVNNPIDDQELLRHWWTENPLPETPDFYRLNHHLWLFLDGLNELPLNTRKERVAALKALVEDSEYPIPTIITCRVEDYEQDEDISQFDLPVVYIHELDNLRIKTFIEKYQVANLWLELIKSENEPVLEMARNPYKLRMLVKVYQRDGMLPSDLRHLYAEYLELTFNDYTSARGKKRRFLIRLSWRELEVKLKELAFRMLTDGNGLSLDVNSAVKRIGNNALRDGIDMGILKREGQQIQFYHQSLQGYFAIEKLGRALRLSSRWNFAANNTRALIRQIGDLGPNATPAIDALVQYLSREDRQIQNAAAQALGEIGSSAIEPLIHVLEDNSGSVHTAAAGALEMIGDPAVEPLVALVKSSDWYVRNSASNILVSIGASAVEPLFAILENEDAGVRREAIETLASIGDVRAVEPLIAMLEDQDSTVRSSAAAALGAIKDTRAIEPLVFTLNDQSSTVRSVVSRVLVDFDRKAVNALIAEVRTGRNSYYAARVLVDIGNSAVEPLIAVVQDGDVDGRTGIINVLGEIRDSRAIGPLISILNNQNQDEYLWSTVDALEMIGDSAAEPLMANLNDSDAYVRNATIIALGRIRDARALNQIIHALQDIDEGVRRAATEALGRIGEERAVEPLIGALNDNETSVQCGAAWGLGEIGSSHSVEPLIAELKNRDPDMRKYAADALGKIGDKRAIKPLIDVLGDSEPGVRYCAVWGLGRVGDNAVFDTLVKVLSDPDEHVRSATVEAIEKLYDERAIDILTNVFEDDSSEFVRSRAADALKNLVNQTSSDVMNT